MYVLPYGQMSLWGYLISLTCYIYIFMINFNIKVTLFQTVLNIKLLYSNTLILKKNIRLRGKYRIGPHSLDVLSIIFGTLLGDGHAEIRENGNSTRFCFYQEDSHVEYIIWLHKTLSDLGYCNETTPKISNRLGKGSKVRKYVRFNTWSYTSFNWIHELWYVDKKKVVPQNIGEYLTPLALAIWIIDDGARVSKGLKLCTNSFTYSEVLLLVNVLNKNFNLKASVISAGKKDQYVLYVWKQSMDELRKIVLPYILPEIKYKII